MNDGGNQQLQQDPQNGGGNQQPVQPNNPGGQQQTGGGNQNSNNSPFDDLLTCQRGEIRRRYEVRALSDAQWNRFVNAVDQLKNNPDIRSRRNPSISPYDDLAILHTEFVQEAHGGAYFLPWHRLFLFLYESLLREIDPEVTIPYWNWSLENTNNAAMSNIWDRFGRSWSSQQNPQCIQNGPWSGWWSQHPNNHCVQRGFTSDASGTFPPLESWTNIGNLISSNIGFHTFTTTVEAIHGSAHVGVGGDMAVLGTAPNDPVFYLHHCFVDYIYYRWQRNGNGNRGRFGGTHPTLNGASARRSDLLSAFERQVRHGQGLNCVRYIDSAEMQSNPRQVRGRSKRVAEEPEETPVAVLWNERSDDEDSASSLALVNKEKAELALKTMQSLNSTT